jgi:hypothetical protein
MSAPRMAFLAFLTAALVAFAWWYILPSSAHDWKQPNLDQWYGSLQRPGMGNGGYGGGASCCSKTDCHTTDAEYRDGEWWARLGRPIDKPNGDRDWELEEWIKIPDHVIVRSPSGNAVRNEAGEAVICHPIVWKENGHLDPVNTTVFCFVPGNNT